jgi:hypothetical protein
MNTHSCLPITRLMHRYKLKQTSMLFLGREPRVQLSIVFPASGAVDIVIMGLNPPTPTPVGMPRELGAGVVAAKVGSPHVGHFPIATIKSQR